MSRFLPADAFHQRFFGLITLERGLIVSALVFLAELGLLVYAVWLWSQSEFGPLPYLHTMRLVIPGVTLAVLSFQNFLTSWFVSILGLDRR